MGRDLAPCSSRNSMPAIFAADSMLLSIRAILQVLPHSPGSADDEDPLHALDIHHRTPL
jgi:hypothetical protein